MGQPGNGPGDKPRFVRLAAHGDSTSYRPARWDAAHSASPRCWPTPPSATPRSLHRLAAKPAARSRPRPWPSISSPPAPPPSLGPTGRSPPCRQTRPGTEKTPHLPGARPPLPATGRAPAPTPVIDLPARHARVSSPPNSAAQTPTQHPKSSDGQRLATRRTLFSRDRHGVTAATTERSGRARSGEPDQIRAPWRRLAFSPPPHGQGESRRLDEDPITSGAQRPSLGSVRRRLRGSRDRRRRRRCGYQ